MKIKKYSKLKGNKYNVFIDDFEVKLYDDVIVKYQLLRKNEIDLELYEEIVEYNNSLEAYYKVLKYISKKLRTEKEVYIYLEKDYTKKVCLDTIKKLKDNGYLNKDLYLKSYFLDAINLSNKGPNKIKKELMKLGYEEAIINDKLNDIDDEVWIKKIEHLVGKKISNNKSYGNNKLKEKILYELSNLGYYKWMIEEVINRSLFKEDDSLIQKEYNKLYNKLSQKYEGYELESRLLAKLVNKGFYYDDVKNVLGQIKKD